MAEVVTSINSVEQEEWDACATGCGEVNPFLLWTFLHCLEESGSAVSPSQGPPPVVILWLPILATATYYFTRDKACTFVNNAKCTLQVKEEGWLAQHILIRSAATRQLLACMPLYLKVCIHLAQ